jgi:hypothetical protein
MSISKIALAIPLSLGIACSTTGGQSSEHTGAMWSEHHRDAATQAYMQGTGSSGSGGSHDPATPQGSGASSDSGSQGSAGSMGSSGSSAGSSDSGSTSGSSSASGSSGTADSPMGAIDPAPGSAKGSSDSAGPGETQGHADHAEHGAAGAGDAMAHSDDQLLRGKVSKVSKDEISITPKGGEAKTLKIKPETTVTINGKDAKPTQLKQGQMVRASYASQDGDDVAVKIEVGKARQGKSGASGKMKGHHGAAPGQGDAASPTGGDGSTGRPGGADSGASGGSR